ncbi:MAG: TolC family protein [Candidatus Ancaeobacter aquaticus]|nr:TolC family protein [Candidatus Ancaeobacter aquaticus]
MKKTVIPFLFLLLFLSTTAHAERVLTLDTALMTAYKDNPRMIEARESILSSKGDKISTMALSDPEISFDIGGLKKEHGQRIVNLDKFDVSQDFDPIGVYWLKNMVASNDILIEEEGLKSVWSAIYVEVREAYTKLILDKKREELALENLIILRQFFSKVQLRYKSGSALKNDVQRAKIETLTAETEYLFVEKAIKTDKAKLNVLMGRSLTEPILIEEELEADKLTLNLKELQEMAFSRNPYLKKEQLILDSKDKKVAMEHLNRFPAPFVGFERMMADYDNDYTIILGMTVPLWDLNQGEVKKAEAQKKIQQARKNGLKKIIAYNVYEAFLDAELSQRQLEILTKSIEEANELLRLANLKYGEGEIDFINYLDQVRTATQTRTRYYQGLFDFNNAITKLEKIVYRSVREENYLK